MFAEFRSARPKIILSPPGSGILQPGQEPLVNLAYPLPLQDRFAEERSLSYQLPVKRWELLLCQILFQTSCSSLVKTLIFGFSFAVFHTVCNQANGFKRLTQTFNCSLIFLLAIVAPAKAQSFETPRRDRLNPSVPLTPKSTPLEGSLTTPPVPESVRDIPGKVVIKKFEFVGGTVFSQTKLNQVLASFANQPISFAQLVQAANLITKLYVDQGYITSGAYIPAQNLNSGVAQIQIVEGSLAEIDIDIAEGRLRADYLRTRLESKVGTPLNLRELQTALQLLQLNPLIKSLDAELSAGIEPGTNSLAVSVAGSDTFKVQTRLNNNRNPSIGTLERSIRLEEGNLFGIGDRLYIGYSNTQGSDEVRGGYRLPINARDGSLSFDLRSAKNEIVESPFDEVDIDITSANYDLSWRQPVLQRASSKVNQELALSLTASKRESRSTILDIPDALSPGANDDGEIRTSSLSLGQEWLQRDRQQVIAARSQFTFVVDALNATTTESEPDGEFFSWRGQLSYLRLLSAAQGIPAAGSTILLRSELQLAADPLISTEQFSLGGAATVRGYRQDALLTDNGFSAAAELRIPLARWSQIGATLQFSPFIDFGTGWNADAEEPEFSTLLGTGFGLLLQTEERLATRVDWGFPLINGDPSGSTLQEAGVQFQLEYQLF